MTAYFPCLGQGHFYNKKNVAGLNWFDGAGLNWFEGPKPPL